MHHAGRTGGPTCIVDYRIRKELGDAAYSCDHQNVASGTINLMWPPPIFISFTVVWFLNVILIAVVVKQSRVIRQLRRYVTKRYVCETTQRGTNGPL